MELSSIDTKRDHFNRYDGAGAEEKFIYYRTNCWTWRRFEIEKMYKNIKIVSILLLIQTVVWLILTIISMSDIKSNWTTADYVKWVSNPNIFFKYNYINATILTFTAIILFTLIFNLFHQKYKNLSSIAFVFVPIYGLINIVCYSIQITIVPLISKYAINDLEVLFLSSQLIQANNQTLVGYLNGLAYAILGIPSIIFGLLLIKKQKRFTGAFLSLSGFMSIIGIIGFMMKNIILSSGIMIGGIVFLLSLIFMSIEFKYRE